MADTADLMRANLLEVFNERDAGRRQAAIARTYHSDVQFSDPEETVVGWTALDSKAQALLDRAPGFVFSPDGPVRQVDDLGQLAWGFGPAGAPPVVRGTDIALVRDGLVARVYTLLLDD